MGVVSCQSGGDLLRAFPPCRFRPRFPSGPGGRPRSHGYESQHTEALQNAATGRWTSPIRVTAEKAEKLKKQDHFPGFLNFLRVHGAEKAGGR